jgi:hypothetical protein
MKFLKYSILALLCLKQLLAADLGEAALKKYEALWTQVDTIADTTNAFWQLAIGFETLLDYCIVAQKDPQDVINKSLAIFNGKINGSTTWWWDDFGWWGLYFMKASTFAPPQERSLYEEAADYCFNKINDNAPSMWQQADPAVQREQEPLFDGGCFNKALVAESLNDGLQGIQNTVTNVLFLQLSAHLFLKYYEIYLNNPDDSLKEKLYIYFGSLSRQYSWFFKWFNNYLLNNKFNLIEERVSLYKNKTCALGYMPNRAWIADQGVMMVALDKIIAIKNLLDYNNKLDLNTNFISINYIKNIITTIYNSVTEALVDNNNILVNYRSDADDAFPYGDNDDYVNGTGVFLRSLICYTHNLSSDYLDIIHNTSSAAAKENFIISNVGSFDREQNSLAEINAALALKTKNVFKALSWLGSFSCGLCCNNNY